MSQEGTTDSGAPLYVTRDSDGFRYFTSLRQASFYARGLQDRAVRLARSYAIDQIDFRPGDVVIDCGANYGDLSLYFQLIEANYVQYVGIEPGRDEFECLEKNIGVVGGSILKNVALGEANGSGIFYYDPDPANSSLIAPQEYIDTYSVEIRTLDSLLSDIGLEGRRIRLLKLEAEGYEPEILLGAGDALPRIDYIAADLGFERGQDSESTAPAVVNLLLASGFRMHALGSAGDVRILFENQSAS